MKHLRHHLTKTRSTAMSSLMEGRIDMESLCAYDERTGMKNSGRREYFHPQEFFRQKVPSTY